MTSYIKDIAKKHAMQWIENIAYSISGKSRAKKFAFFLKVVQPLPNETLIDVGVNNQEYSQNDNYLEKHYPYPANITAIAQESLNHFKERYPHIKAIVADGTRLPFPDNAFDIGYSNAVIEHVGNREKQKEFLSELLRVSKRGFFTTPNRHFPIEVHTRVPLLHLILSKNAFDRFLQLIGKNWATGDYMYLLSRKDLETLFAQFPEHTFEIHSHRFLGLTLTFSVFWRKKDR